MAEPTPGRGCPDPASRAGAISLGAIGASAGLTAAVGVLGPSAVQAPLPGTGPPFELGAHPPAVLVIALQAAALLCGAAGLGGALLAVRRGWSPPSRHLMIAGTVAVAALVCLPPVGTADPHAYASYGRMVTLGANPYAAAPEDFPDDPVASAARPPWREEPSPYGPLATAEQAALSWLGGDSLRTTVFLLSVVNGAAFAGTGWLLHVLARGDRRRRLRAALLWMLNPILLHEVVAGAHLDALALVLAVGAVAAVSRSALASGVLLGAAAAIKAPLAMVGGGLLHGCWPRGRRMAAVVAGSAAAAIAAYGLAGGQALAQLQRVSGYISLATPWHLLEAPLSAVLGADISRGVIRALALVCWVALAALLAHGLPRAGDDRESTRAARTALAIGLAWLLTAPYVLPWYDALAWALLAFLPWSRFDGLLLVRTTLLASAYLASLPARLPAELEWLVTVLRAQLVPVLLVVVTAGFVLAAARADGGPLPPRPAGGRQRRAPPRLRQPGSGTSEISRTSRTSETR